MSTETLSKLSDILETLIGQESPGKQRDSNSINALLNSVLISYENRKLNNSTPSSADEISEIEIVTKIFTALTKMFSRNPSLLVDEGRHITILKSIFPFFNYLNCPMELTDEALFTLVKICTDSFRRGLLIHNRLLTQQREFTLQYLDTLISDMMKSFTNSPAQDLNQGELKSSLHLMSIETFDELHNVKLSKISLTVKILQFLTHPSITKLLFAKYNTSYILDSYITKTWFCLENIVINIRSLNDNQELIDILDNIYSTLILSTVNHYLNDDSRQMNRLTLAVSSCRNLLKWPLLNHFNNLQTVLAQCLLKLNINLRSSGNALYLYTNIGISFSTLTQYFELIESTKHADLKRCLLYLEYGSPTNGVFFQVLSNLQGFHDRELQSLEQILYPDMIGELFKEPAFPHLINEINPETIKLFENGIPQISDSADTLELIEIIGLLGTYSCYLVGAFDLATEKCKLCDSNFSISSYIAHNVKINRLPILKGSKIEEILKAVTSVIHFKTTKENQHLIITILISITKIFRAFRAPLLSEINDIWTFLKTCFVSPLREIRMLTVKIFPLIVYSPDDLQYEADIDTIISFLFSFELQKDNYYVFEGYIATLGELLTVKSVDSRYYIILRQLILFMAETNEFISNLAIFQLKQVASTKDMTPWKVVEPFIPLISRDVVKSYKKTSGLLENFCISIEMSQRVFLTRTLNYTVPFLVDFYNENPIGYISGILGLSQPEIIKSQLSGILAYLFATHDDISSTRILNILSLYDPAFRNKSFDELVLACKGPFFLCKLLFHYNTEPKTLERITKGIGIISGIIYHEKDTRKAIQLMLNRWLLILVQLISTTLNDKKGSNPYTMKIRAIKSILCLLKLCDTFEACLGQVVTALQLALQHAELRSDALVTLKTVVSSASNENVKFIFHTLLSQLILLYDSCSIQNKEIITETVFLLMKAVPESDLSYRFGLMKIESMRNVTFQHASDRRLVGDFRERMKSDNKWVIEQALNDFIDYLERGQINIQTQYREDELLRNSLKSIAEILIGHSTKTQAASAEDENRTDSTNISRKTAVALSLLGYMDLTDSGNRSLASKAYDNIKNFLLVTNLQKPKLNEQEHNSVVEFSLFFLKNVLVRSFIFSVDPEEQRYISYTIQEYLAIFEIPDKAWKELDALTQNVLTPLKTSRYRQTIDPKMHPFPLYHAYKEYSVWLKEVTGNLLYRCAAIADVVFKSPPQIAAICSIIPILDTTINRFVLPYAVLFLIVTEPENSADKKHLQEEFMLILNQELNKAENEVIKDNLKKSIVTILELFNFLKAWCNKISEEEDISKTNNKSHTKLKRTGMLRVEKFLSSFPTTLLASRCADCQIYEGAIMFSEKSYNEKNIEKEQLFLTLKNMYVELEDFDQLQGALKTFSTNSLSDKLLQFKYNEDEQVSNESLHAIAQYDLDQGSRHFDIYSPVTELFEALNKNCEYDQLLLNLKKFGEKTKLKSFDESMDSEWVLYGLQASIYTGDLTDLEHWTQKCERSAPLTIPGNELSVFYEVAQSLVALRYGKMSLCSQHIDKAISYVGILISNSQNGVHRKIPEFLSLLHSLQDFKEISKMKDIRNESTIQIIRKRFQASKMDFRSKWKIFSMRTAVYKLHQGKPFEELYKDSLIEGCQILRENRRLPQATKLITKALVLNGQKNQTEMTQASTLLMNVEFSKLFWAQNDYETALKNMKMIVDNMNSKNPYYLDFTLTYLNWMDESAEGSSDEIKKRYLELISDPKFNSSADVFYQYASYLSKILEAQILEESDGTLDIDVIRYYFLAVRYSRKYAHEVLPKAVTLWLDYYQKYLAVSSNVDISRKLLDSRHTTYQKINLLVDKCVSELGNKWYVVLSQIISRITHEDKKVTEIISKMIIGLATEYPSILLYSIFAQARSVDNSRRAVGTRILAKLQDSRSSKDSSLPKMIASGLILLESIMAVCNSSQSYKHPKSGIMVKDLYKDLNFDYPRNSACLSLALPIKYNMDLLYNLRNDANKKIIHYNKFHEKVRILFSLQQPKRVKVTGTNGAAYFLLFKPKDDLRKDNKVMEFSTVMNGLLAKDYESQRRNMHIKSFAATPLNEATGIIEWVQNFVTLRPIIERQLKKKNITLNLRNMKSEFGDAKPDDKLDIYESYVQKYPAVLGEWMMENAPNVTEWYSSRSLFTRSVAVMSIVGYLIGVGDRHLDNVMINKNTGMIMHIDFDCIFEKGKRLGVPEIVPFRLTPNLIDAMGVLGYEGSFRKSSELTMSLIRGNEIILMNFLESFIHDPLMDWRGNNSSSTSTARSEERLLKIKRTQERVYKIIRRKIRGVLSKDDDNTDFRDSGGLSVSVSLQVELLIQTASSHENLSKMFFGWMPFL